MNSPIQEQDFDFRKHIKPVFSLHYKTTSFYHTLKIPSVIVGLLLLCSSIYSINHITPKHSLSQEQAEVSMLSFKSLSPASLLQIEHSLKDVFSINSAFYADNSSVRRGIVDTQLDKVQGDLLKHIHSSIDMHNVNDFMSVDSHVNHISVLSFDSSVRKMIIEVQYSATFKYTGSNNIHIESRSSRLKQYVSISLDKHSHINNITLLS